MGVCFTVKKDSIGMIILNPQENYNTFCGLMRQNILDLVKELSPDDEVPVVIIIEAEKVLCAGGDVDELV